jgi:hypothetical protein
VRLLAALIGRSAKQGRLVMFGCFALLSGMQVVIVGQAAAIEETSGFGRLTELVPAFLQRGLGNKSLLLVTFRGTVAFGYFEPVVVVLVAVLAIYFATVLLMAAGTRIGLFFLASPAYEAPSLATTASLLAHLAAVALCFAGIGLAIASYARRWSTAFTLGALCAVVLYLVHLLAIGWPPMRWIAWMSPFNYYPAFSILAGDASTAANLTILLSAAAVFSAVGYRRFLARDL